MDSDATYDMSFHRGIFGQIFRNMEYFCVALEGESDSEWERAREGGSERGRRESESEAGRDGESAHATERPRPGVVEADN